jgi:hypothetical protein
MLGRHPNVPRTIDDKPQVKEKNDEEEQLRKLQAEMTM